MQALHDEVKTAESYFQLIQWLQDRFPEAKHEDVAGLCKLASPEEVKEQDYSPNPGRYVGVVIEEDGKTEEEFAASLFAAREQLFALQSEAHELESVIGGNLKQIAGESA